MQTQSTLRRSLPAAGAALALLAAQPAPAAETGEHPHDTLSRALAPFVQMLARDGTGGGVKACRIEFDVIRDGAAKARVAAIFRPPDAIRIEGAGGGKRVSFARAGQRLWIAPGADARAFLEAYLPDALGEAPAGAEPLGAMTLPLRRQELLFLPAVFRVEATGEETVDGESCRVLDLQLQPELAAALKLDAALSAATGARLRVWVAARGLARIRLEAPGRPDAAEVAVRRIDLGGEPPESLWAPPGGADVLELDGPRVQAAIAAAIAGARPAGAAPASVVKPR